MGFLRTASIAAALTFGVATASSAATLTNIGGGYVQGDGFGESIAVSNLTGEIDFRWNGTPFAGYVEFTTDVAFDFLLTSFDSNASSSDVTGVTLDVLDGVGGVAVSRLSTDTSFCSSAGGLVSGDCNLIAPTSATSGNAAGAAKPGDVLFAALAAGTYRFGVYDSASPSIATVSFQAVEVSPVPLPAGGLLLLTGLGALALRRRAA